MNPKTVLSALLIVGRRLAAEERPLVGARRLRRIAQRGQFGNWLLRYIDCTEAELAALREQPPVGYVHRDEYRTLKVALSACEGRVAELEEERRWRPYPEEKPEEGKWYLLRRQFSHHEPWYDADIFEDGDWLSTSDTVAFRPISEPYAPNPSANAPKEGAS